MNPSFVHLQRLLLMAVLLCGPDPAAHAQEDVPAAAITAPWVSTWGTSPSGAVNDSSFLGTAYQGTSVYTNQTVRLIVHASLGGKQARLRLSNEYGTRPLTVGAVRIALSEAGESLVDGSDRPVTFGGRTSVTLPPGAPMISDAVKLDVPANANLAVSIYLPGTATVSTGHSYALQTNYVAPPDSGDTTAALALPLDATAPTITQWPLLTGVDVRARHAGVFVAYGSSITSGVGSELSANHRWPDYLSARFQRKGLPIAVVNASIPANRVLSNTQGAGALARFDLDVLSRPGVKYVLVTDSAGVEIIGGAFSPGSPTAEDIVVGLKQLITRAHARGILIFAGTLLPLGGSGLETPESKARRLAVNDFIRSGAFDGVADFEAAVLDPEDPGRLLPALDSGDHHHPNDEGYRLMARSFDVALVRAEAAAAEPPETVED